MAELTKAEKLLVAAGRLAAAGKAEFTAEDLVVAAHKEFPTDFSMKGYPEFPDSNTVLTQVMGKKAALIVRGWLDKVGAKQYRLTPKGVDDLNSMASEGENVSTAKLDRAREEEMGNLLTSIAFDLAREGRTDEVTFYQFCRFIGLNASDKWQAAQGKITHAEHLADSLRELGDSGQPLRIYAKNRTMTFDPDDLRLVKPLFDTLMGRFRPQLDGWRRNAAG
jgi:hypothetical protein